MDDRERERLIAELLPKIECIEAHMQLSVPHLLALVLVAQEGMRAPFPRFFRDTGKELAREVLEVLIAQLASVHPALGEILKRNW